MTMKHLQALSKAAINHQEFIAGINKYYKENRTLTQLAIKADKINTAQKELVEEVLALTTSVEQYIPFEAYA